MPFAVTFGELVGVLAKYDCMPAIQKLVSDPDVKSGLHGKGELEAIGAARRIVEECDVGCDDVYNILDNSNVKGELAAEKNKRKFESEGDLWAEGRALLAAEFKHLPRRGATQKQKQRKVMIKYAKKLACAPDDLDDELVMDEQEPFEQHEFRPSSPAYSPTEPHYQITRMPPERAPPPAF